MSTPLLTPLESAIFDEDVIAEMEKHIDDAVPCIAPNCTHPAWWRLTLSCCGSSFPMCDAHVKRHKARASEVLATYAGTFCRVCRSSLSGKSYDEAFTVVLL